MLSNLKRMVRQQEGATAVEYGIMVALIAAVIIAVVVILGKQTCEGFQHTTEKLDEAPAAVIETTKGSCD